MTRAAAAGSIGMLVARPGYSLVFRVTAALVLPALVPAARERPRAVHAPAPGRPELKPKEKPEGSKTR